MSKIYFGAVVPNELSKFYLKLLNDDFKVKIFDKTKNREIYNYFLAEIRNTFLWTFNIKNVDDFYGLSNDIVAPICNNYYANIFEKGKDIIVCFETGIIFVLSKNKEVIDKYLKKIPDNKLEEMDLKSFYEMHKYTDVMMGNYAEAHLYAYILELYKKIYVKFLKEELLISNKYEYCNYKFLDFKRDIYENDVTNKDGYVVQVDEILNVYSDLLDLENEFYRIFKAKRKIVNKKKMKFFIIAGIVMIILLIIITNLGRK